MGKTWVTIFPQAKNFHLVKDVGYIPYIMYKNYGYNSKVVCYNNDKYDYLDKDVKGLKIDFIKRIFKQKTIDSAIYLLMNSRNIDVLQVYHLTRGHLIWIWIYKKINKQGKVFLKLDTNDDIKNIEFKSLFDKFNLRVLKKVDLITVETKILHNWLRQNWEVNVEYIPNGFIPSRISNISEFRNKKNIILSVGRIGAPEKNNEMLIESFFKIYKKLPNWKVKFVGEYTGSFKKYLQNYVDKEPEFKEKVILVGHVADREVLDEYYREAKIFCLTSLYESFGLVLVEAIKNGCYILTTDVLAANDITNNGQFGKIFKSNDKLKLEEYIQNACNDEKMLENLFMKIIEHAYENFSWDIISNKINELIRDIYKEMK
ncbi:glycosyltransferase family 4 protein [Clostridium intestinale]|uniref:glycosyltransferase family 4 protein n=1 Tax=Clostridium intestinale TaxID=36845 RepID=UPI002DD68BCB|nr:glycosyltransferase family 4 protein [Clostridium intestinale]WRY49814.1 glycosyltransferase family 4 protein [Clostridium intestinale]